MKRFSRAIVRTPGRSLVQGLTSANLGAPDYENALTQHMAYIAALEQCGLEVTVLPPDEAYPDSTFVEDAALLTPRCAVITRPGALPRQGEAAVMKETVRQFFTSVEEIVAPGTLEAGDVMMVGDHYYIGLSERTNARGADQLIEILGRHGMSGSVVRLESVLHLKTGVGYLEDGNLLACGEFLTRPEFQRYNLIEIDEDESYAANSLWINGTVLVPKGYPKALSLIEAAGYPTIAVDVSEFRKLDGGLSCLSLRF
jgi:dimethylargininase